MACHERARRFDVSEKMQRQRARSLVLLRVSILLTWETTLLSLGQSQSNTKLNSLSSDLQNDTRTFSV
jgi:hypothetical protein